MGYKGCKGYKGYLISQTRSDHRLKHACTTRETQRGRPGWRRRFSGRDYRPPFTQQRRLYSYDGGPRWGPLHYIERRPFITFPPTQRFLRASTRQQLTVMAANSHGRQDEGRLDLLKGVKESMPNGSNSSADGKDQNVELLYPTITGSSSRSCAVVHLANKTTATPVTMTQ